MAKDNRRMTPADEAAVVMALARGATIREAAAGVGFAARTLLRRRRACALFGASWEWAVAESAKPLLIAPGPGGRWQAKRRRVRFTRERKTVFLEYLVATCNVQAARQAAGICSWTAYHHRRTDPVFGLGWEEALEVGSAMLAAEAERALAATDALIGRDPYQPFPRSPGKWLTIPAAAEDGDA